MILDPDRHSVDLTYFHFRSAVSTATVNFHVLASSLSLEFSFCLPQLFSTSASSFDVFVKPPTAPVLVTTPQKSVSDISFKLGNISDDILSAMDEDQMRILLIDARDTLSSPTPTPSVFVQPSNLFTSPLLLSSPAPTSSCGFVLQKLACFEQILKI